MYKLKYSNMARYDIRNIYEYIKYNLFNDFAAINLFIKIDRKIKIILDFPYLMGIKQSLNACHYAYRNIRVKNYLVFYIINEKDKEVIIARVIYRKRNVEKLLK